MNPFPAAARMSSVIDPNAVFEAERPRLWALAYRMLGSLDDAEDVVQETWLRWHAADHGAIASPGAWLTTACTRLAIDALRAARRTRESYVGPWLPEPVVHGAEPPDAPGDPAELAESLSLAFLLVLERLSPTERAAYLLHDVFGYGYPDLARVLGKAEPATRQIVSRARRALRGEERFTAPPALHAELLTRFLHAVRGGEVEPIEALLAHDVEMWSDGGGKVRAARNVVHGASNVARFFVGILRKDEMQGISVRAARVNGRPGVLVLRDGVVAGAVTVQPDADGRVARVLLVMNPDKLRRAAPAG